MAILTDVAKNEIAQEILSVLKQLENLETTKTSLVNRLNDLKKTIDEGDYTVEDKAEVATEMAKIK